MKRTILAVAMSFSLSTIAVFAEAATAMERVSPEAGFSASDDDNDSEMDERKSKDGLPEEPTFGYKSGLALPALVVALPAAYALLKSKDANATTVQCRTARTFAATLAAAGLAFGGIMATGHLPTMTFLRVADWPEKFQQVAMSPIALSHMAYKKAVGVRDADFHLTRFLTQKGITNRFATGVSRGSLFVAPSGAMYGGAGYLLGKLIELAQDCGAPIEVESSDEVALETPVGVDGTSDVTPYL